MSQPDLSEDALESFIHEQAAEMKLAPVRASVNYDVCHHQYEISVVKTAGGEKYGGQATIPDEKTGQQMDPWKLFTSHIERALRQMREALSTKFTVNGHVLDFYTAEGFYAYDRATGKEFVVPSIGGLEPDTIRMLKEYVLGWAVTYSASDIASRVASHEPIPE